MCEYLKHNVPIFVFLNLYKSHYEKLFTIGYICQHTSWLSTETRVCTVLVESEILEADLEIIPLEHFMDCIDMLWPVNRLPAPRYLPLSTLLNCLSQFVFKLFDEYIFFYLFWFKKTAFFIWATLFVYLSQWNRIIFWFLLFLFYNWYNQK